jgi:hypothetical protein
MNEFTSFEDFFPHYVAEHSKAGTRWMHFVGTHLGVALGSTGIARRRWGLVAAAPAVAYGMAWFSHFVIEGNKPATFGHPAWSFRGDWKMLGMMWTGRDGELGRMAQQNKVERVELALARQESPERAPEPVAALP